jgi:hypothetical protein
MYTRFRYAFSQALKNLEAVLKAKNDFVILPAFIIAVVGFVAMQIAIDHGTSNVSISIVAGCVMATLFFLSTVGFITLISTIFILAYSFTIGLDASFGSSRLGGWNRGWRALLSFVVSGAVTAAVFNLFSEGLRDIAIVTQQYGLLSNAN